MKYTRTVLIIYLIFPVTGIFAQNKKVETKADPYAIMGGSGHAF